MDSTGEPPRVVDRSPFEEGGHAPCGFARANTYAFVANQEEDDIENSSPDDQDEVDPFWTELVDLMARKGTGKGKNKINRVSCHDVGVQTDQDANQIFCEIDNALKHLATVSAEAAAAVPLQALAPAAAVSRQRAFDADEHLLELRMRWANMPTSTAAPAVEPPTSASSSGTSQPLPRARQASQRLRIRTSASPGCERSRSRDVDRNIKTIASRKRWGTSSSGGE